MGAKVQNSNISNKTFLNLRLLIWKLSEILIFAFLIFLAPAMPA